MARSRNCEDLSLLCRVPSTTQYVSMSINDAPEKQRSQTRGMPYCRLRSPCCCSTRMLICPPFHFSMRRGARVDESTCLESMRPGNGTVGSNPTLSATSHLVCTDRSLPCGNVRANRHTLYRACAVLMDSDSRTGARPCAIEPCELR